MKRNRIFKNLIEFLLLSLGLWIGLLFMEKRITGQDHSVFLILFFTYGGCFLLNVGLQLILSFYSTKNEKALYILRLKVFGGILCIPILVLGLIYGFNWTVLLLLGILSFTILFFSFLINMVLYSFTGSFSKISLKKCENKLFLSIIITVFTAFSITLFTKTIQKNCQGEAYNQTYTEKQLQNSNFDTHL